MRVLCVGGARPNFVKLAPLLRALAAHPHVHASFVHTGQHYDPNLSQVFLTQLGLPPPVRSLGVGSGTHAEQTAAVLVGFERVLAELQPHVVVVVGDVNSTAACALAAAKFALDQPFASALGWRTRPIVAHVEAGLRSGDLDMPEEHNRRVTDALADLWFTTEAAADAHLRREGAAPDRIHAVGNVMIDSLDAIAPAARAASLPVAPGFALVTLHRPSNVDDPARLRALIAAIDAGVGDRAVVFPAHPRTRARLVDAVVPSRWTLIDPCGYVEFVALMLGAAVVATDSGGVQEETAALGTPCVTLRTSTERPVTLAFGNRLAGTDPAAITAALAAALAAPPAALGRPPGWDGRAAPRIAAVLAALVAP